MLVTGDLYEPWQAHGPCAISTSLFAEWYVGMSIAKICVQIHEKKFWKVPKLVL